MSNLATLSAQHGAPNRTHHGYASTHHTWHLADRDIKLVLCRGVGKVIEVPHE